MDEKEPGVHETIHLTLTTGNVGKLRGRLLFMPAADCPWRDMELSTEGSTPRDVTSSAGERTEDHLQPWTITEFCLILLTAIAVKQAPNDETNTETATEQVLLRFPCAGFVRVARDKSPVYARSPGAIKRAVHAIFHTADHHALEDALRLCGTRFRPFWFVGSYHVMFDYPRNALIRAPLGSSPRVPIDTPPRCTVLLCPELSEQPA